jgi:hypothetical protein
MKGDYVSSFNSWQPNSSERLKMSWKTFEEHSPELAALGFDRLHQKIAYLAAIKKDGSPRLHPVTPFIGDGMLFIFTEPSSPKIRDLRRDGRYALHCSVLTDDGPLIEFLVSGVVEEITDPSIRNRAEKTASSPVVLETYVLFEFQVNRVLVLEYDKDSKPLVRHWKSDL